jgi:hypothetical protein
MAIPQLRFRYFGVALELPDGLGRASKSGFLADQNCELVHGIDEDIGDCAGLIARSHNRLHVVA